MASSLWKSAVENYVKGKQESEVNNVAAGLLQQELNLLELVEELGPYLTSSEADTRSSATKLLSEILNRIPANHLTQKEVQVLISFFCDRLKDHHSVTPHVLSGLYAVSSFSQLPPGSAVAVVKEIFKEVQVQSLNQTDRRSVYNLLANLLSSNLKELQTMKSDFVYGYIQVMDGERDPRNLMIAFQSVKTIAANFPIKMFAEELFEVTSCYFPVDFNPPANDTHKITKEDLILALRDTLSASSLFAEFAMPLIMEKLSSDIQSARHDSYDLLAHSCPIYGVKGVLEFVGSLFSCVKRDVMDMADDSVISAALQALSAVVAILSREADEAELNSFLDTTVIKECSQHIQEPGLKSIRPCGQILTAAAEASDPACFRISRNMVPLLLEQFQTRSQALPQKIILQVLLDFIRVNKTYSSAYADNPMVDYKDALFNCLLGVVDNENPQLRTLGITGLAGLLSTENLLSAEDMASAANRLLQVVLGDEDSKVRHEATATLAYLATSNAQYILKNIIPVLLKKLESDSMEVEGAKFVADKNVLLQTLSAMSVHGDIIRCTVPVLLDLLKQLSKGTGDNSSEECVTICKCLCSIVQANSNCNMFNYFVQTVLPDLLRITIHAALDVRNNVLQSAESLGCVAEVLRNIVQSTSEELSTGVLALMNSIFLDGDTSVLSLTEITSDRIDLLNISSPNSQTQLAVLLTAVLCSFKKEICVERITEYLEKLSPLARECQHKPSFLAATKCFAGITNKYMSNSAVQAILQKTRKQLEQSLNNKDVHADRSSVLWFWITKSLVLCGHPLMKEYTTKMLQLFENDYFSNSAPDGVFIVMNEFDDIMTQAMNANIRMMYRQRFFVATLPHLIEGFNKTSTNRKQLYLTAVSYLLRFIPKQVLLSELPPLVPLLVQSLLCEDVGLQLSTLNSIYDLMFDAPNVLCQYLDTILPQMLKLTHYQPSMKVRIASIQCIGMISTLPSHHIVPHTPKVLRELASALDDKKRLVRKEAVKARNEWFLLETKK